MARVVALRSATAMLIAVTALIVPAVTPAAATDANTVTVTFEGTGTYVEGEVVDTTITYSDSGYSGTADLQWFSPGLATWVSLGVSPMSAGVSATEFANGYNSGPDPEAFSIRAIVDGVVSPTYVLTSVTFTSSVTGDLDLLPGESTTLTVTTNASYMNVPADLLLWDRDSSEWLFDQEIPLAAGVGTVTLSPDRASYYVILFYDETGELLLRYSAEIDVNVFYNYPSIVTNSSEPLGSGTFLRGETVSAALYWGGFGDADTVTLQYQSGYSISGPIWSDSSLVKVAEDGFTEFSWTSNASAAYRFKVRWADNSVYYLDPFYFARVVPVDLAVNGQPIPPSGVIVSPLGSSAHLSVQASHYYSGSAVFTLRWRPAGSFVTTTESRNTATNGATTFNFVPVAGRIYFVDYYDPQPNESMGNLSPAEEFSFDVVVPTLSGAADSASISAGGSAGATVTSDPAVSGSAYLQYLSGSTWLEFASPVTLTGGTGHMTWSPSKTFTYRFRVGSTYSGQFTIAVTPPTVSGVADSASIPAGGMAGATATVDPAPASGSAYLQYLSGTTWLEFASPLAVVAGQAHVTWSPSRTFTYRFRFGTTYSSEFTITVTPPTVSAVADSASIPAGGTAGATATIDPAVSGSAYLQYLSGSTWVEFASPVTVTGGTGHLTWTPSKTFTYRFRFGSTVSPSFTVTVTAPTVSAAADAASIPAGGTAGATVTIDPAVSGSAYLQYLSGSTWVEFASPVTVTGGTGHLTWTPSKTFTYRFRFGSTVSPSFTVTVTAPTVSAAADAASIPAGGTAGATVTIDPAVSGSAYLQYLSGSTWVEFASPVTVTGGTGHLTWTPSKTFTYRFRFGSTVSPSFTVTVTAPTVSAAADAASIPAGGTAGATVTIDPAVSGSAYLQYLSGSTWVEFASPVTVTGGTGHLTWTPSKTFTYRFRFGSTVSATFVVTVVPTA